jgi:hypothetical protein
MAFREQTRCKRPRGALSETRRLSAFDQTYITVSVRVELMLPLRTSFRPLFSPDERHTQE